MNFITFFLYYTGSMFIYEFVRIVGITSYNSYQRKKLLKQANPPKIQMITIEELMDQLQPSGEDKKKWN